MSRILKWFGALVSPGATSAVWRELDRDNMRNLLVIAAVTFCAVLLSLGIFLWRREFFMSTLVLSYVSDMTGYLLICLGGAAAAILEIRCGRFPHWRAALITLFFVLLAIGWSIFVSLRHYPDYQQIVPFFTVMLVLSCILTLRPILGWTLVAAAYVGMYAALYYIDRAVHVNVYSYFVLATLSTLCISVRSFRNFWLCRNTQELRKVNVHLQQRVRYDALTGIFNREALQEDLLRYCGEELSVMMCDIDSFKSINDGYGHAVGDRAIAATAAFLATLYPKAAVYRYGGDEFLLILRDGGEAASVCLNRREHMLPIQGGTLPISN